MSDDNTLEIHKLVIGADEIEVEAKETVSEYLIERAAFHANKLGRNKHRLRQFDVVKDSWSSGWVLVFMTERWF